MRILLVIALVLAVIALICAIVPTTVLTAAWNIWFLASFAVYLLAQIATGVQFNVKGT